MIQHFKQVVSDANAEDYLKELDLWKQLYDKYSAEWSVRVQAK